MRTRSGTNRCATSRMWRASIASMMCLIRGVMLARANARGEGIPVLVASARVPEVRVGLARINATTRDAVPATEELSAACACDDDHRGDGKRRDATPSEASEFELICAVELKRERAQHRKRVCYLR